MFKHKPLLARSFMPLAVGLVIAMTGLASDAQQQVPDLGQFKFHGEAIVLPLTAKVGQPIVLVDLGDGEKRRFIVDTGASVNVLDSALAESLGLGQMGEIEIGAPGGQQIPAAIVKLPLAHIGAASISNAEFVTIDLVEFSGGLIHGVLGMGLFKDYLLTFDYAKAEIRVSRETLNASSKEVIAYNDVSGHIQIDMNVAGTTLATHVDTGSMAAFTLPVELKETLLLRGEGQYTANARMVGGERRIFRAQIDGDIHFAGTTFPAPHVGFMDPSPGYGNVGSQILSQFVMSVDQRNHLLRFQRAAKSAGVANDRKPRRLGVQFRGMPGGSTLTIGRVEKGSPGEKAGFLSGDHLTHLNGKPMKEYDMAALGTLIRGTDPLRFELERDGESKTIEVP